MLFAIDEKRQAFVSSMLAAAQPPPQSICIGQVLQGVILSTVLVRHFDIEKSYRKRPSRRMMRRMDMTGYWEGDVIHELSEH